MITMHTYTRMTGMVCVPQFYDVEGPTTPSPPYAPLRTIQSPAKKIGYVGAHSSREISGWVCFFFMERRRRGGGDEEERGRGWDVSITYSRRINSNLFETTTSPPKRNQLGPFTSMRSKSIIGFISFPPTLPPTEPSSSHPLSYNLSYHSPIPYAPHHQPPLKTGNWREKKNGWVGSGWMLEAGWKGWKHAAR